jgi:nucleoid DNA-binding protein
MKKQKKPSLEREPETDSNSLTKRALVVQIAKDLDLPQQLVYDVVQMTLDGIIDALLDGKHVEFRDFGVFEIATRKARIGRNPKKPQDVFTIPERQVVKFKPGRRMKQISQ